MPAKILIVEDDKYIAKLISYHLKKEGYEITHVVRGDEALALLLEEDFDLVILDLMLPGIGGLDLCRRVREFKKEPYLPIIMLTAKDEETDKIIGLEVGANDYVTKPFSPKELTARVKAHLRSRSQKVDKEKLSGTAEVIIGPLTLNPRKYSARINNIPIALTPKEFELIHFLSTHPGQVFTRDILLETIWGFDYIGDTRTVDVHIRHIRQKIEEAGYPHKIVETVRGVGYRLKE